MTWREAVDRFEQPGEIELVRIADLPSDSLDRLSGIFQEFARPVHPGPDKPVQRSVARRVFEQLKEPRFRIARDRTQHGNSDGFVQMRHHVINGKREPLGRCQGYRNGPALPGWWGGQFVNTRGPGGGPHFKFGAWVGPLVFGIDKLDCVHREALVGPLCMEISVIEGELR